MTTYTAITTLNGSAGTDALAEAMEDLDPQPTGVGVFEIEDGSNLWEIGGYFEAPPDETALSLLAAAFGARPFTVSEVPDEDWVARVRRELPPVEAGRFFVYGSHDADKVPADGVPLLIEAAMAFGTGHHGTTKGCLLMFERLLGLEEVPRKVADVGCGTAVLAMAAAHVGSETVIAGDIDVVAVEVAEANVVANGLAGRVRCVEATGFDHPDLVSAAPFDLVFANILKGPLIELAPEMSRLVRPGGHVILSGLLTSQALEISDVYLGFGFNPVDRIDIGEWSCLMARRAG